MKLKSSFRMANVPANSLVTVSAEKNEKNVNVLLFQEGIIKLSGFAIMQFLEGAELLYNDSPNMVTHREIKLVLKLSKKMIAHHELFMEVQVSYEDLKILRSWLEVRMAHCERERDERTLIPGIDAPKFNPDTYIGQKLLLMDLRELMLGEII